MSLGPLYVFLGEVSVQVLCPFFNWVVCLPGVWVLYIFWTSNPCLRHHWQICFPIGLVPFCFADVFFSCTEAFHFDEVPFVYSFLHVPRSHFLSKICFPYLNVKKSSIVFITHIIMVVRVLSIFKIIVEGIIIPLNDFWYI